MASWVITRDHGSPLPEVEVFVPGPDGEPLEFQDPATPQEILRQLGHAVTAGIDQLKDVHAAPGQRMGSAADRADRRGAYEDVVTPLLLEPALATAAAMDGGLFAQPLPRLDVDERSLEVDSRGVSWRVTVRTGVRRRRAALRLSSSPSANVTVLELVPERPRFLWSWTFVRVGVAALDELGRRLSSAASGRTAQPAHR